jgi:hypothetical protein
MTCVRVSESWREKGETNLRVKFAGRVEVVVVGRQAGFLELPSLLGVQHAEGGADLHAHAPDLLDHFEDALEAGLAAVKVPPCCAHAEPGGSSGLGLARFPGHNLY